MESYYTRFYKLINEMIRNNLTVATMQINVQFLQQIQPEWSRFVTIVKQQHKLDEVSYHKLFDILRQYRKEVNELGAERLAREANPLALVATAQANQDPYYQTSKSHKSCAPSSKPSIPTRSHTTTRYKGKEIAKPITPPSETASEEDNDPKQAQRDKDMQKNLALIAKYFKKIYKPTSNNLRTSSNLRNKNVDTILRLKNDNQSDSLGIKGRNAENRKGLRTPCITRRICCYANKLSKELEAHYSYMAKIQEVPTPDSGTDSEPVEQVQNEVEYNVFANDLEHSEQSEFVSNTCLVETDDSNVIPDSPDMCEDDIQNDQNDVESDDDRVVLANLKLDVDENKKIQKQLKKANTTLAQELKECKAILAETTQLQDKNIAISELKKLIEKGKGKSVDTKFDKPSVVRQPNAQRIPKPSVLGKPTPLSNSLDRIYFPKTKSIPKANVSDGLSKLVTVQTLPQTARKAVSNTNVLKPGMYRIDNMSTQTRAPQLPLTVGNTNLRVSTSTRVNHKTNVSRPQLKSNQSRDKVLPNNSQIVQLILFIVDSECTKHTTCNLMLLCNFVEKFLGNDLLTDNRGYDLYTISLQESTSSTPLYLMAKASPTQAWLWYRRLSHLNFDYINLLSNKDIVIGLPKLKYVKDQLCSSCELSKAKRSSFKSKVVSSSKGRLNLLHMDLCGPMRVASIIGKKYILVIVDDYSRYTWTFFLCSKDATPEVLKEFLTMIQRNLQAPVITVRTDRGTEFLNKTLNAFFKEEGIENQTSTAQTPEQNGVIDRRNRTLVEAARTMLSALKLPLLFWAEAIAIA
uniref:Retrovirus-related Pol polyprotein from transposon TNT 1-94 n=1 Tax=Tanacetum cinerariifolium TaxID=118510 RepID=A0A6L2MZV8_TANCI|nr:retrovirus-related Pol polyprotein from transposon TNT 1-94 [Tanacetum cinerariifolium]